MIEKIEFPYKRHFYESSDYEAVIRGVRFSTDSTITRVDVCIGPDCKFLADVILKLLCLCHHVVSMSKKLTVTFEGGATCKCYSFLERCGFLRSLPASAEVSPPRSDELSDRSLIFEGNSRNLLEMRAISPTDRSANRSIPSQLTSMLGELIGTDCEDFLTEIQTVVCEFCDNVREHSETELCGYVYVFHYQGTGKLIISVADLGVGLLNSLKKGLSQLSHPLAKASDQKLIQEMFNSGLSRKGEHRGSGLNRAAGIAIKYKGQLHVRLDCHVIDLTPNGEQFAAWLSRDCATAVGTHITFTFDVSNL